MQIQVPPVVLRVPAQVRRYAEIAAKESATFEKGTVLFSADLAIRYARSASRANRLREAAVDGGEHFVDADVTDAHRRAQAATLVMTHTRMRA